MQKPAIRHDPVPASSNSSPDIIISSFCIDLGLCAGTTASRSKYQTTAGAHFAPPISRRPCKISLHVIPCSCSVFQVGIFQEILHNNFVCIPCLTILAIRAAPQLSTSRSVVRSQARSSGICGGKSGTRAGFLRVLLFPRQLQWPRGLRHELSSLARTLGSWVRFPLKAWMSVICACILCLCLSLFR
jgi:hypothetical protein